jgi:hypothetical protein
MVPVLHWESSEIECPCEPWTPPAPASSIISARHSMPVKIEVCGGNGHATRVPRHD